MEFLIQYTVDDVPHEAPVLYDPFTSIDSVVIEFSPNAIWIIAIDFFETTHDWGGDIASIVTPRDVIIIIRDYKRNNAEVLLIFDKRIVTRMLNKIYSTIEAADIVIPWQREHEVDSFLDTL